MCGISVYYHKKGITRAKLAEIKQSLKRIAHRGPDGEGCLAINTTTGKVQVILTDETPADALKISQLPVVELQDYEDHSADLVLGHRRLSIIDLSVLGHQPMKDAANGNWLVFNGEIYNYIELREDLKRLGHSFVSDTDSEVILKAYDQWGAGCFSKFNGMWSVVLWDQRHHQLIASNDRYGVKPLFYYKTNEQAIFVSEQKQLFEFSECNFTYDTAQISEYLRYSQLCTGEDTFLNEVKRFRPGHSAVIDLNKAVLPAMDQKPYYTLRLTNDNYRMSEADAVARLKELLDNAVKLRMRADVPYGFALSGGLDSTMVLYSAFRQKQGTLASFSAVFPGMSGDESEHMSRVTKELPLKSYYAEPFKSFTFGSFRKHIYHQDYPVQSTSYYAEYELAKTVKASGYTVLLVGQGADELFAGYTAYFYEYGIQLLGKMKLLKLMSEIQAYSRLKNIPSKQIFLTIYNQFKQVIKYKLKGNPAYSDRQKQLAACKSLDEVLKLDLKEYSIPLYLHSDDADGMAFGIESRHPFLDYNLVDFAYTLPEKFKIHKGWQKYLLRRAADGLPEEIRWRRDKMGYTTPHQTWIDSYKSEFESYAASASEFAGAGKTDLFRQACLGIWLENMKTNTRI